MDQTTVTVVMAGEAFKLNAGDPRTLAALPPSQREQLISLLEALRAEDTNARARVEKLAAAAAAQSRAASPASAHQYTAPVERMGTGDVDALMARLVMEENMSRKPAPDKSLIYKVLAGVVVVLLLLALW